MKTEKASLKETSTVETSAPKAAKTTSRRTAAKKAVTAEKKVDAAENKTIVTDKQTITAEKPAAKTPAKKAVVKEKVYLQYLGKEIDSEDVMKKVKEQWTKVLKNKVGDIKSITIYMKPEENAAYYVINGDVTGNVEL